MAESTFVSQDVLSYNLYIIEINLPRFRLCAVCQNKPLLVNVMKDELCVHLNTSENIVTFHVK